MVEQGADILDVGGESTRPGAEALDAAKNSGASCRLSSGWRLPAHRCQWIPIRPIVAREAVARGAVIVNDISALEFDHELGERRARTGAAVVLMHNRGRSDDMDRHADYENARSRSRRSCGCALARATDAGIDARR